MAIKVAPFNRYQTIEVVRALAESGRAHEIALYTGNDDNLLLDLLTTYRFKDQHIRFAGGLLGHWAVWTKGRGTPRHRQTQFNEVPSSCSRWPNKSQTQMQRCLTLHASAAAF